MSSRFGPWIVMTTLGLLALAACDLPEPVHVGGLTLNTQAQELPQDKTQAICRAIEAAGYIMPYGPPLGWYRFGISRSRWVLSGPQGTLLTAPNEQASTFILVDWHVPADMDRLPDAVTQETVEQLTEQARKICRIVQREAARQGIGPVLVNIRLWDLIVGFELEYGRYAPGRPEGGKLVPTSDCEQIKGYYAGKSNGLNPDRRTPGRCPSLYIPN